MPLNDFFRTLSLKTYSHSSPYNHEYPCSLFSGSVTTTTGQWRQEPMLGTREERSLKAPFCKASSPAFDSKCLHRDIVEASLGVADVTAQQFGYFCRLTEPLLSAIHVPAVAPQCVYCRGRQEG